MIEWKKRLVEKEICNEKEVEILFCNIEDIANISKVFLDL